MYFPLFKWLLCVCARTCTCTYRKGVSALSLFPYSLKTGSPTVSQACHMLYNKHSITDIHSPGLSITQGRKMQNLLRQSLPSMAHARQPLFVLGLVHGIWVLLSSSLFYLLFHWPDFNFLYHPHKYLNLKMFHSLTWNAVMFICNLCISFYRLEIICELFLIPSTMEIVWFRE